MMIGRLDTAHDKKRLMKVYIIADDEDRLYAIENAILHNGDTFHVSLESMRKVYSDVFFMNMDAEKERMYEEMEKKAFSECDYYYSDNPDVVIEGKNPYFLLV